MTRAAEVRAFLAEHPVPPEVVDDAPPLPAEALEILRATGFPFRAHEAGDVVTEAS